MAVENLGAGQNTVFRRASVGTPSWRVGQRTVAFRIRSMRLDLMTIGSRFSFFLLCSFPTLTRWIRGRKQHGSRHQF